MVAMINSTSSEQTHPCVTLELQYIVYQAISPLRTRCFDCEGASIIPSVWRVSVVCQRTVPYRLP